MTNNTNATPTRFPTLRNARDIDWQLICEEKSTCNYVHPKTGIVMVRSSSLLSAQFILDSKVVSSMTQRQPDKRFCVEDTGQAISYNGLPYQRWALNKAYRIALGVWSREQTAKARKTQQ